MYSTPVLLIIFNRPDCTKQVLDILRKIKPKQIFIAADGPRKDVKTDSLKCKETRDLIGTIDWECELKTLFQENNLGCKEGVSKAIDWFFENIEEGIILEDDIIPDLSFFPYCEYLLNRYRNDKRIMMISGHNPIINWNNGKSYLFSKIGTIWGWASWKRSWNLYQKSMPDWERLRKTDDLRFILHNHVQWRSRKELFDLVHRNYIDTWDYQWTYSRLFNYGLSIVPSVNLVNNIGFDENATHTKQSIFLNQKVYSISFPLLHQNLVYPDFEYDNQVFKSNLGGGIKNKFKYKVNVIKNLLEQLYV